MKVGVCSKSTGTDLGMATPIADVLGVAVEDPEKQQPAEFLKPVFLGPIQTHAAARDLQLGGLASQDTDLPMKRVTRGDFADSE